MIIERIVRASGLEKEEIERKVEAKRAKLSGLISKEGAAQIIAAELGINFDDQEVKIQELLPGMRKANIVGKVIQLFPVREYKKENRSGKVASFICADETGNVRVVMWDMSHISKIESGDIKEGDVVSIKNAMMRGNELHLSGFSEIKKSDAVMENVQVEKSSKKNLIKEVNVGESVELRGTIVQIFPPRFYVVCPECKKKLVEEGELLKCEEHGIVKPEKRAVFNFVLDDGTETIRVVLFSDQLSSLFGYNLEDEAELSKFMDDYLGSEVVIKGDIRRNRLFDNLEIISNSIEKVDVDKLIEELESQG